jgi:L-threonylcarbamoyladenylate synthase
MKILGTSDADLAVAAGALREGKLVAIPTETVYGLGGNGLDPVALARIFEAKRRPTFDPLILHIAGLEELNRVADLSLLSRESVDRLDRLSHTLWPGPLTLILPKRAAVPDLATSGLSTVAVRFPAHGVAQRIIRLAGVPIAAPSANPFGYLSPTRAEHVAQQLGDRIDYIVDGGRCSVGVESTILDLSSGGPRILRPGGTARERIEGLIGPVELWKGTGATPTAPGQLASHYAPHAALELYPRGALERLGPPQAGEGYVFFDAPSREAWLRRWGPSVVSGTEAPVLRLLSEGGSLLEAAANLFEILHELDSLALKRVYVERVPDEGLGAAINDRLFRARSTAKPGAPL